jgi:hypothetical protein
MYWSVHQYQKPMMAEPGRTASHGHSGSLMERMRWMLACRPPPWWHASRQSDCRDPVCASPMKRMQTEPKISTGVCNTAVYMITRMPPKMV